MQMNKKQSYGFSLVELMVAMVVGLVIISGAFSLHSTTRKTQQVNEAQMDMVADARFATEMIAYDLRHAGVWGGTNRGGLINCRYKGSASASCTASSAGEGLPVAVGSDCAQGWYYDLDVAVTASDNTNPFSGTCIPAGEGYVASSDVLQIRYAEATPPAALLASQAYVRSHFNGGRIFVGATQPVLDSFDVESANHELHAYAYYISNFTDAAGDGIPSLRRVALVNGPALQNQILLSGITDLQVQFGIDLDGDFSVDRYVDPDAGLDPSTVVAAKIWLLMRSDDKQNITKEKTFTLAGTDVTKGADGYRYFMVSSVVNLRNLRQF
jgi:type IV pilus assembly protein PilW